MKTERTPLSARLDKNGNKFTASEASIAEYLMLNYPMALMQNASEIANELNLNVATITRFFAKLGYNSSKEALSDFKEEIEFAYSAPIDWYTEAHYSEDIEGNELSQIAAMEHANLDATMAGIDMHNLQELAHILGNPERKVFIIGTLKEYTMAYYLYVQLFSLKEEVFLYGHTHVADFMSCFDSKSICIFFDFRRNTNLNKKMCEYAKNKGAIIVSVSNTKISPTSLVSDYQFIVSTKSKTLFDSYSAAIAFLHILITQIIAEYEDILKERYSKIEEAYHHLDTFITSQKSKKISD